MFQADESATKTLTSLVGAIVALISAGVAIWSARIARKNHKDSLALQQTLADQKGALDVKITSTTAFFNEKLAEKKQEFDVQFEVKKQSFQKELEAIRADFDDQNAEKRARRDYEYEARQRLYREIEPLIFQLTEKGEETLYRISGLAGEARNGNLLLSGGWLSDPAEYYTISNMYKFIAPLAIVKLMQRKLTAVDLRLVPQISALYTIARYLSWTFTDDFVIKKITNLPYDPNNPDWANLRQANPKTHWRQGIPTGRLDKAVSALIDDETGQCKSFGEFEDAWRAKTKSPIKKSFDIVFDLFCDFHPQTRPILWRILLIQAHLYFALILNREQKNDGEDAGKIVVVRLREDQELVQKNYDWRQDGVQTTSENEVFVEPFETAEEYLQSRLKELYYDGPVLPQQITLSKLLKISY